MSKAMEGRIDLPINHTPIETNIVQVKKEKKNDRVTSFFMSNPQYTFSDVILPEQTKKEIDRFISLVEHQQQIFEEWKLGSVIKHHNLCINLYGASGTGKTMTAHAIANTLKKKMIIVNYAEIESKYVGETSKNLVSLFEYAKSNDAVILFDEADALLSRRVTAMHSATDVSVNQTRNMLLKIMDEYEGVVIFTTNFFQNFDSAFLRRIFTHVKFELPNEECRKRIFEHYLLVTIPIDDREKLIENICKQEGISAADITTAVLKAVIDLLISKNDYLREEDLKRTIGEIKQVKTEQEEKYEVTTRKVTEEYALQQINKGGISNGITQ